MKSHISIKVGNIIKQILLVSYTRDGGLFVKDLIKFKSEEKCVEVVKFVSDTTNDGIRKVKPFYSQKTHGEVKLSHHADGWSHISGEGVLSGYEADGTPKGASIKSFPLTHTNDGGPFISFAVWGYERICRNAKETDILLIPNSEYIHPCHQGSILNGVVVKFFYFPKSHFYQLSRTDKTFHFLSPIEGPLDLTLLPSPEHFFGVIGVVATWVNHGFTTPYGFTLQGAPGPIYNSHFCDNLSIIYPVINKAGSGLDW